VLQSKIYPDPERLHVFGELTLSGTPYHVSGWLFQHAGVWRLDRIGTRVSGLHAAKITGRPYQATDTARTKLALAIEAFANGEISMTDIIHTEVKTPKIESTRCTVPTGATGQGPRCPRPVTAGKDHCWFHSPEKLAERSAARIAKAKAQDDKRAKRLMTVEAQLLGPKPVIAQPVVPVVVAPKAEPVQQSTIARLLGKGPKSGK
jgi:hypothetical protein